MSINFRCAACKKKFKGKDQLAGKSVKCPSCGKVIVVSADVHPPATLPAKSASPKRSPDATSEDVTKEPTVSALDQKNSCPRCKVTLPKDANVFATKNENDDEITVCEKCFLKYDTLCLSCFVSFSRNNEDDEDQARCPSCGVEQIVAKRRSSWQFFVLLIFLGPVGVLVTSLIGGFVAYMGFTGYLTWKGGNDAIGEVFARYATLLFLVGFAGAITYFFGGDIHIPRILRVLNSLWCACAGSFLSLLIFNAFLNWVPELLKSNDFLQHSRTMPVFSSLEVAVAIVVACGIAIVATLAANEDARKHSNNSDKSNKKPAA